MDISFLKTDLFYKDYVDKLKEHPKRLFKLIRKVELCFMKLVLNMCMNYAEQYYFFLNVECNVFIKIFLLK